MVVTPVIEDFFYWKPPSELINTLFSLALRESSFFFSIILFFKSIFTHLVDSKYCQEKSYSTGNTEGKILVCFFCCLQLHLCNNFCFKKQMHQKLCKRRPSLHSKVRCRRTVLPGTCPAFPRQVAVNAQHPVVVKSASGSKDWQAVCTWTAFCQVWEQQLLL